MATPPSYDDATLAGSLKARYGDKVVEYLPAQTKLRNMTTFDSKHRTGLSFNQMITLTHSGGTTYAGPDIANTAFDLNEAIPATSKNSTVTPDAMIQVENVPYGMTYSAQGNDEASFIDAQEYAMKNLVRGLAKRIEIKFWHGGKPTADQAAHVLAQTGIGTLDLVTHTTGTTTAKFRVALEAWAPGIWYGSDSNLIDAVNITVSGGAFTSLAVINSSKIKITYANLKTREISVSGTAADLDAIAAVSGASNIALYWNGSFGQETLGVKSILGAVSGTLFGITLGAFSAYDPIASDALGAPLTFQLITQQLDQAESRGMEEDVDIFVPSVAWNDLMNDQAALRRYDSSYRMVEANQGFGKLEFENSTGRLRFHKSQYVKAGQAFIMDLSNWSRKGATEIALAAPNGMPWVQNLPQNAGYQARAMAMEAMYCQMPSRNVFLYNVGTTHSP